MLKINPLEYLEFNKDDIYLNLIAGDFYSPEKAKEIIQTLEYFIKRLSEVRNSNEKTNLILNEIDKFPDNEMRSIKHWLVKLLEYDDSFAYAFNPLAQYSNGLNRFLTCYQIKTILRPEIYEILKEEEGLNKVSSPITKAVDYSDLLFELKKYIGGISDVELTKIIEKRPLTSGTPKARWIGIPADAARFADYLVMSFANFNKLFDLNGVEKLLPNHRQKVRESGESTTSEINTILEKFIPK